MRLTVSVWDWLYPGLLCTEFTLQTKKEEIFVFCMKDFHKT